MQIKASEYLWYILGEYFCQVIAFNLGPALKKELGHLFYSTKPGFWYHLPFQLLKDADVE